MNKMTRLLALLLALVLLVGSLIGCSNTDDGTTPGGNNGGEQGGNNGGGNDGPGEFIDYVSTVKLDKNSGRAWCEATVKSEYRHDKEGNSVLVYTGYVDGDTTHFVVPKDVNPDGILKARYLAINTPESTGQIEPWGKAASNFTKSKLKEATSIILESETDEWNFDSNGRNLVWVWYKTAEMADYRCLNLEILQVGLSRASGISECIYADVCQTLYTQAMRHKLYLHDTSAKDPDFYYGDAVPMTLKEVKVNVEKYVNTSVAFEGVVIFNDNNGTAYVEEFDEETGEYFGMQIFYGYSLSAGGKKVLSIGNRIVVAGSVQYYEAGDTYQISDIYYDAFNKNDPNNIRKLEEGHAAVYDEATVSEITKGTLNINVTTVDEETGEETSQLQSFDFGYLTLHSSKKLTNLTVESVYTTSNGGKNDGAHSITCRDSAGNRITIRTAVLYDENNNPLPKSYFEGKVILEACGIIDAYDGEYQLKVFHQDSIIFK